MEQPFTVGEVAHFQLNVRDVEKSLAFYRMFDPSAGDTPERARVALGPQTRLILHHEPALKTDGAPGALNHFAVVLEGAKDVEGVLAYMREFGAEPFDGPRANNTGRTQFRVSDPDGNEIEVQLK